MGKNSKNLFLPALTGLIAGLAFSFSFLYFIIFAAFIPLFFAFDKTPQKKKRHSFYLGFSAGFVYYLFIFQWLWSVFPLDSLGLDNKILAFPLILAVHILSAAIMAVFWGGFAVVLSFARRNWRVLSLAPFVFTFFEFLRAYAFGIFWYGSETFFGPHWTIGNLAYIASSSGLFLFLSRFGGIYFLTIIIIIINLFFYWLLSKDKRLGSFYIIIIIFTLFYAPNVLPKQKEYGTPREVRATVIQTKEPSSIGLTLEEELSKFRKQIELLKQTASQNPASEIVIFPEGSDFFKNLSFFLSATEVKEFFSNVFKNPTLIIDHSEISDQSGKIKSRTLYLDSKKGLVGWYDKRLLTPGGEFLPYLIDYPLRKLFFESKDKFEEFRFFNKGDTLATPLETDNLKLGTLICSDLFSPSLGQKLAKDRTDLFIFQSSTGLFKGNSAIVGQIRQASKIRAAENGVPAVLATNYGISSFINSDGETQKSSENTEPQLLTDNIVLNNKKTLYNKIGDAPFAAIGLLASLYLILRQSRLWIKR